MQKIKEQIDSPGLSDHSFFLWDKYEDDPVRHRVVAPIYRELYQLIVNNYGAREF